MKNQTYITSLENKMNTLIARLDTCNDSEVSFIHSQLRRTKKELLEEKNIWKK
jgi:hypothetical protein